MNELAKQLDKEKCKKWRRDKTRNPVNNQRIQEGKIRYKQIEKICARDEFLSSPKIRSSDAPMTASDSVDVSSDDAVALTSSNNAARQYYPSIDNPDFPDELGNLQEFSVHTLKSYDAVKSIQDFDDIVSRECPKSSMNKAYFQYFIQHYLSSRTPYRSVLLYYSVGVGKTCSAVSIAEGLLESHNFFDEPKVYVIVPASLKSNFLNSIFDITKIKKNQCTGRTYLDLAKINIDALNTENDIQNAQKDIKNIIKRRYKIFSYGEFIKQSTTMNLKNKVIIVDEAHNVRNAVNEGKDVSDIKLYDALKMVLENGDNNRLILMSGTPMYNEPNEIVQLLNLLLINERLEPISIVKMYDKNNELRPSVAKQIASIAKHYISYVDNKNPFSYAVRLSPKDAIKDPKDVPVKNPDLYSWISNISDGIIMTELGKKQIEYIKKHYDNSENLDEVVDEEDEEDNQGHLHGFQALNFVYKDKVGETGFWYLFERVSGKNSLMVRYRDQTQPLLKPDKPNLGAYGSKILKVCQQIDGSEGIVVVYSRLLWGGAIPLAIALEHMGFNRYGVSNNLLDHPRDVENKGSYVILTSPVKDLMGTKSQSIDSILNKINSDSNKNGDDIKVIIITQKASEGLSFFNVRQVHVLDPWFHMNRIEQIVGRGIRRCSHTSLPIEKRNVLVYLHCGYMKDRISIDVNAYRIASRKIGQMIKISDVIRNNSLDCGIQKNINFYSKFMFKSMGDVNLITSRGEIVPHVFGEYAKNKPKCAAPLGKDMRGVREDTMDIAELLAKNIVDMFKKTKKRWISLDEIIMEIKVYEGDMDYVYVAMDRVTFPNKVLDGYTLHLHNNGIQMIKNKELIPEEIQLEYATQEVEKKATTQSVNQALDGILNVNGRFEQKWYLYMYLTSLNWKDTVITLSKEHKYDILKRMLIEEGAIIERDGSVVAYVDVFDTKKYSLYDLNGNLLDQDATQRIQSRMREISMNNKSIYGTMAPGIQKKNEYASFDFKIHEPKDKKGKVIGASCLFKPKEEILKKLGTTSDQPKLKLCIALAQKFVDEGSMLFYPVYKPK